MRKEWAVRIWHNERLRFSEKFKAIIAVLGGRFIETDCYDMKVVAYLDCGFIHTDCGDGRALEVCAVKGFEWTVYSDSTI